MKAVGFRLSLLGRFLLERDGQTLPLRTRKEEALLAYLALFPGSHTREALATLFWGDTAEQQARASLRAALADLRSALGPEALLSDRLVVQLNPDVTLSVDVLEFQAHAAAFLDQEEPDPWAFDRCLYCGDLLPGHYDDWVLQERERLRLLYLEALLHLVRRLRTLDRYEEAIVAAQRALVVEPAEERAHQHLIFLYAITGNRSAAVRQLDACRRSLREELDVEPSPETLSLLDSINPAAGQDTSPAELTNLPTPLTSFIGREREIAAVGELLLGDGTLPGRCRLITLTGPGGSGKTRLAIQVARSLLPKFLHGVWWIDLGPLGDASLVADTVLRSLGAAPAPEQSPLQSLTGVLRERTLMLALDNCEHLVEACAQLVSSIVQACPHVQVLATSREPLGVPGEQLWPIPSLSVPAGVTDLDSEALLRYEAVDLFVERARMQRPAFRLGDHNAAQVTEICRRLDGIPLAIELAAARVRSLEVDEILDRLQNRLQLLASTRSMAVPRHQTLRASIDWSHDLLSPAECLLFRRLGVFVGGWTLSSAEAVCADSALQAGDILDLLARLVDRSLVIAETGRYRFLETIREYALERLSEAGETKALRNRHAGYFDQLAKSSFSQLWGPQVGEVLIRLELEHDNLRAALEWLAHDVADAELFMHMASVLWRYWEVHGHLTEGRTWLERALATGVGSEPEANSRLAWYRANALRGAGNLARQQGDYAQAIALHEKGLELFHQINSEIGVARELDVLGEIARSKGEYAKAVELHNQSLAIRQRLDDKEGSAASLGNLGIIAHDRGDYARARELLEASLKLNRELGDKLSIALRLNNLGLIAYDLCEYARAWQLFEEGLHLYQELADRLGTAHTLQNLANVAKDMGDFARADSFYSQCLTIRREIGDKRGLARTLGGLAELAFFRGDYRRAAELIDESAGALRDLGIKKGLLFTNAVAAFAALYRGQIERAWSIAEEDMSLAGELGAPRTVGYCEELFGLAEYMRGRHEQAVAHLHRAAQVFQQTADKRNIALSTVNLARGLYRQGDLAGARQAVAQSLGLSREIGDCWGIAFGLEVSALLERSAGKYDRAALLFRESLQLSATQANRQGVLNSLGALAGLAALADDPARSARLFGAAEKLRESLEVVMAVDDRAEYEAYLQSLRGRLDPDAFAREWEAGRGMTQEEFIAEA